MRLHRFFGDFNFREREASIDDANLVNQIKNVLRLKKGDRVLLANGSTEEAEATIVDATGERVGIEIESILENDREPSRHVVLYVALLKSDHFELVVQKATEVGVSEIVPLITERTVKLGVKKERLNKIIREAAEQSGRAVLPKLHESMNLEDSLRHAEENDANYFFDIEGEEYQSSKTKGQFGVFVGPEGGWTDAERELVKDKGASIVTLGKLTLRAETAAIVSTYLVIHT